MHALQVQQLLEMGADADAKDKRGISALHYASGQGRLEVLQFLWSRGLDLDADDPGIAFNKLSVIQPTCGPLLGMRIKFPHLHVDLRVGLHRPSLSG